MFDQVTQNAIEQELFCAENARLTANEGKARVCARRAAGIAVRTLLATAGIPVPDPSAYSVLAQLNHLDWVPVDIKECARHLLTRVRSDYSLPPNVDLIADARKIISWSAAYPSGGPS